MKFSILFLVQPTADDDEATVIRQCVEQAVLADTLGYRAAWFTEHHGWRECSHASAPEVLMTWVAAKTQRLRLGSAITLTPRGYNHPLRVAERIATLDVLSEGRVDFGTGKSVSRVEQDAFGIDVPTLHEQWLESQQVIVRAWQEEVLEHRGRFVQIPPIQVVPKPVQSPHPPLFAAASKPDSVRTAGELGLGALNFAAGTEEALRARVATYRTAVAAARPELWAVNDHFVCASPCLVLPDDRSACRHGVRGASYFERSMGAYAFTTARPTGSLGIPDQTPSELDLDALMAHRSAPEAPMRMIVGDPAAAQESVARFAAAGVDELLLLMQLGQVPHEVTMQSMRTFAEHVMPTFA